MFADEGSSQAKTTIRSLQLAPFLSVRRSHMKLGWAALGCVLALSVLMPGTAAAQSGTQTSGKQQPSGTLKQNYPNPFNPETRIPFRVGDAPTCSETRTHRVSLRIYNVLAQLVAVPMIEGGSG